MPKVLVANNSELLRHLAAPSFRRLALDLIVASNGIEAMSALAKDRPSLAILDAEMPSISGYDIAQKMRDEGHPAKVVLVAILSALLLWKRPQTLVWPTLALLVLGAYHLAGLLGIVA